MAGTPAISFSIVRREGMVFRLNRLIGTAAAAGGSPWRAYNCIILTGKPNMEAEKINALANSLADLGARAKEMRRYL
jgi:hypothetical protein